MYPTTDPWPGSPPVRTNKFAILEVSNGATVSVPVFAHSEPFQVASDISTLESVIMPLRYPKSAVIKPFLIDDEAALEVSKKEAEKEEEAAKDEEKELPEAEAEEPKQDDEKPKMSENLRAAAEEGFSRPSSSQNDRSYAKIHAKPRASRHKHGDNMDGRWKPERGSWVASSAKQRKPEVPSQPRGINAFRRYHHHPEQEQSPRDSLLSQLSDLSLSTSEPDDHRDSQQKQRKSVGDVSRNSDSGGSQSEDESLSDPLLKAEQRWNAARSNGYPVWSEQGKQSRASTWVDDHEGDDYEIIEGADGVFEAKSISTPLDKRESRREPAREKPRREGRRNEREEHEIRRRKDDYDHYPKKESDRFEKKDRRKTRSSPVRSSHYSESSSSQSDSDKTASDDESDFDVEPLDIEGFYAQYTQTSVFERLNQNAKDRDEKKKEVARKKKEQEQKEREFRTSKDSRTMLREAGRKNRGESATERLHRLGHKRSSKNVEKHIERVKKQKNALEEKDQMDASHSFQPKITRRGERAAVRRDPFSGVTISSTAVSDRILESARQREEDQQEDLTFHPKINNNSRQMASSKATPVGDRLYAKAFTPTRGEYHESMRTTPSVHADVPQLSSSELLSGDIRRSYWKQAQQAWNELAEESNPSDFTYNPQIKRGPHGEYRPASAISGHEIRSQRIQKDEEALQEAHEIASKSHMTEASKAIVGDRTAKAGDIYASIFSEFCSSSEMNAHDLASLDMGLAPMHLHAIRLALRKLPNDSTVTAESFTELALHATRRLPSGPTIMSKAPTPAEAHTFKPQLNPKSKELTSGMTGTVEARFQEQEEQRKTRNTQAIQQAMEDEIAECTFHPALNHPPSSVTAAEVTERLYPKSTGPLEDDDDDDDEGSLFDIVDANL